MWRLFEKCRLLDFSYPVSNRSSGVATQTLRHGHNAVNYKDPQKSQSSYHACESLGCQVERITRQLTLDPRTKTSCVIFKKAVVSIVHRTRI